MIVTGIVRAVQLLFAAVVLGLSVSLIKGQIVGNAPAITNYAAFTGGFGIIVAAVGVAALFVDAIQGIIMMAVDGLCALFFLAGGIAVAVHLKGVSCGSDDDRNVYKMILKDMLNGGCATDSDGVTGCGYTDVNLGDLAGRCRQGQADSAFMFFGFLACIGAVVLMFFGKRKSGGAGGIV